MTKINSELPEIERAAAPVPSMGKAILGSLAAAVLALVLFSWLADEVFEGDARRFDDFVRAWVHQYSSPALTSTMMAISLLGSVVLVGVFTIALMIFLRLKWRRAAVWLLLAMAGAVVLDLTLKYAFHRPRPAAFFGPAPHSYSFPSGHSLFSFCIYGVLAGLLTARIRSGAPRALIWLLAAGLVAAIGTSRIYLGVHYPSDVIAGYFAAAMWVSALIAADRMRKRKGIREVGVPSP
jgi:undecaprenyl-diphosphatase